MFAVIDMSHMKHVESSIRKSLIRKFSARLLLIENFLEWKMTFSQNEFILSLFSRFFTTTPDELTKQQFKAFFQTTSKWVQEEINDQNDGKIVVNK